MGNFPMDICFHPLLLKSGVSFHHELLALKLVLHVELLTFSCGLISVCFLLSQCLLPSLTSFLYISFHFGHHLFPGQRHFFSPNSFSSQNLSLYTLSLFSFKGFCSLGLFSLLGLGPLGFLPLLGFSTLGFLASLSLRLYLPCHLRHMSRHFTRKPKIFIAKDDATLRLEVRDMRDAHDERTDGGTTTGASVRGANNCCSSELLDETDSTGGA